MWHKHDKPYKFHKLMNRAFEDIDLEQDGVITKEEFVKMHSDDLTTEEIDFIFEKFDKNRSGKLNKADIREWLKNKFHGKMGLRKLVRHAFEKVDLDEDGTITKEELVKVNSGHLTEADINKIFEEFDKDKSGRLDKSEIRAWMNSFGHGVRRLVHRTFRKMDLNGDGYITKDELLKSNEGRLTEEEVTVIFERFDKDKDGKLSKAEVRVWLQCEGPGPFGFRKLVRRAFDGMELDKDGKISRADFEKAKHGQLSTDEINILFERFDKDKTGFIDKAEVRNWLQSERHHGSFGFHRRVARAFEGMDLETDGKISKEEFAKANEGKLKPEQINCIFERFDKSKTGFIEKAEVRTWLKSEHPHGPFGFHRLVGRAFEGMELEKDGKISKEEFVKAKQGQMTEEQINVVFDRFDKNKTGFVEKAEVRAWLQKERPRGPRKCMMRRLIERAFKDMDLSKDGVITKEELLKSKSGQLTTKEVDEIFEKFDKNKSGKLKMADVRKFLECKRCDEWGRR
ncbi:unnamed protein product [Echinostoma caproni]|uniref:Calmodulin n=1 Tax=Echinostoma caproni TaxID=27848 RepID=A0A183AGK7_9TREM|nr:unnamed protein product [Echinostoma caproni]